MNLRKLGISLALGALIAAGAMVSPASAVTPVTTGTWVQYPTGAIQYQAEVQQPINSANTSNWSSKSKGAVPVMFKLSSRTGPAVFQSTSTQPYSYMSFDPNPDLTFSQISDLHSTYSFASGNCHGGSLRWEIDTAQGNLFIYYGDAPNFTDCTTSNQSGVNMIGQPDLRYDTSQIAGGTFYDTYAHALTLIGNVTIQDASLVLDGGWGGDQVLNAGTTATVNDNPQTWNSGGSGGFAATCDLPAATIEVSKISPTPNGLINEEPVQNSLVSNGNAFRVIDCKYQYVLSIPSLDGAGRYDVEILIGGTPVATVPNPDVRFDLK